MAYPIQKIASVAAMFLGLAFASGCQKNYNKSATCQTKADCPRNGAATDFQVLAVADCCMGFCVAEASGCDTGLRYLVTDGTGSTGVGDCVSEAICKADFSVPPPPPDLTPGPPDLTPPSNDM
jgi:hypothetical protein